MFIPNNGIYGFDSLLPIRLNGQLDSTNFVSNGDFATDDFWQYSSGSISGGVFNATPASFGNSSFLSQGNVLAAGFQYILTFDCVVSSGTITSYGTQITSSGSYTVNINTATQSTSANLVFGFDGSINATIDNVSLTKTPSFDINVSIVRSSNNGTEVQTFDNAQNVVFAVSEFQQDFDFIINNTFPTFKDERITIEYTVTALSGSVTSSTIKSGATFQTVLVDDGGGDLLPVNSSSFPIYKYKFKKALTFAEFKALRDAPESAVLFSNNGQNHIFGWRNSIDYDRKTGETTFELRSKTKIKKSCQQG